MLPRGCPVAASGGRLGRERHKRGQGKYPSPLTFLSAPLLPLPVCTVPPQPSFATSTTTTSSSRASSARCVVVRGGGQGQRYGNAAPPFPRGVTHPLPGPRACLHHRAANGTGPPAGRCGTCSLELDGGKGQMRLSKTPPWRLQPAPRPGRAATQAAAPNRCVWDRQGGGQQRKRRCCEALSRGPWVFSIPTGRRAVPFSTCLNCCLNPPLLPLLPILRRTAASSGAPGGGRCGRGARPARGAPHARPAPAMAPPPAAAAPPPASRPWGSVRAGARAARGCLPRRCARNCRVTPLHCG